MINTLIKFRPLIKDIGTLAKLTYAFATGNYRYISKKAAIGIIIAFLYLLSPIDMIPDFFSIFSFVDDALVLGLIAHLLREDLDKFNNWNEDINTK